MSPARDTSSLGIPSVVSLHSTGIHQASEREGMGGAFHRNITSDHSLCGSVRMSRRRW
ncbi:hypothetical protein M408DRAFT_325429 [Serendipita vermifera MAFF 305830]|uniref:Uncharacterized protein n=1 Tax=Serendipita vermifera MAFF 305830 TaxID=933852 RepID=A0A0C2X6X3_SERVB|nr:hypothetical protein M408DRAFT_325429 [Serendipita vermifera MAFF 305830]